MSLKPHLLSSLSNVLGKEFFFDIVRTGNVRGLEEMKVLGIVLILTCDSYWVQDFVRMKRGGVRKRKNVAYFNESIFDLYDKRILNAQLELINGNG